MKEGDEGKNNKEDAAELNKKGRGDKHVWVV